MKALVFLVVLPAFLTLSVGCSSVITSAVTAIDKMSDDELAAHVESLSKEGAKLAISYATWKDPAKAVQIQKDSTVADQVVRQTILPYLQNAPAGTVLAGAIGIARQQLASKLTGSPIDTLVLVFSTAISGIPTPAIPGVPLSPRLQKAIASGFLGLAEGIEETSATSPAPVPAAPPPTPAPPPK